MNIKPPFIRSPYNYDLVAASDASGLACADVSLTDQSQAVDADINVIMKRYGITGRMPDTLRLPSYGDYASVTSYSEALAAVMRAEDEFMAVPAEIRSRFDNNPQKYLDFVVDPANVDQLRSWGMLKESSRVESRTVRQVVADAPGAGVAPGGGASGNQAPAGAGSAGAGSGSAR